MLAACELLGTYHCTLIHMTSLAIRVLIGELSLTCTIAYFVATFRTNNLFVRGTTGEVRGGALKTPPEAVPKPCPQGLPAGLLAVPWAVHTQPAPQAPAQPREIARMRSAGGSVVEGAICGSVRLGLAGAPGSKAHRAGHHAECKNPA